MWHERPLDPSIRSPDTRGARRLGQTDDEWANRLTIPSYERLGAACIVIGSTLLAIYAVLFTLLVPIGRSAFDYSRIVLSPYWTRIAFLAFIGVVSMLAGLDAVYSRMRATAGFTGTIGLLFTKVALLLQACVLTWELLLDPIVAAHPESSFLLRDRVIVTDPAMVIFRWALLWTIAVGALLFGLAVYRSTQFPKPAIGLIVVGALVYAVGPMVSVFLAVGGVIMFSIGCLLIGVRLWRVPVAQ